jgi:hypothetical protein
MRICVKLGFRLPTDCLYLSPTTTSLSPLPKTYKSALLDPNWAAAMQEEFQALLANQTWQVVPHPRDANSFMVNGFFAKNFTQMVLSLSL